MSFRSLAAAVFAVALAAPAFAQADQGRIGRSEMMVSTAPGYYVYHQPGEATIQVSVEGTVRNPGLYEVAVGTDLGRVLALAGGPAYDSNQPSEKQRVEVRLFRPEEGIIYGGLHRDLIARPELFPALRENDSVIVESFRSRAFGWRDALAVAGGVASVAFLVDRISQ